MIRPILHCMMPIVGNSKLYFCTYTSVTTSAHFKSHLPAELGRKIGRNSLFLIR